MKNLCKFVLGFVTLMATACGGSVDVKENTGEAAIVDFTSDEEVTSVGSTSVSSSATTGSTGEGGSTTSTTDSSSSSGGGEGGAGPEPECSTDADCFQNECLVFKCMNQQCFAFERDDDDDGYSSCGGTGTPGAYDCNDADAAIYPGADEVCGSNVDHNCNGQLEEGCWEFCEPFPNGQGEGVANNWYSGCCALNGVFKTSNQVSSLGLYKGSSFAIYYLASDGKRYRFPFTPILQSWYGPYDANNVPVNDPTICASVVQVPDNVIASIAIGGNVTMRPGTYVTNITTDPGKRYAIEQGGILRPIADDAMGIAIFGASYQGRVQPTPDYCFINYLMGSPLASAADYDPIVQFSTTLEQDLSLAP